MPLRLQQTWQTLFAQALFWSVTLALMLEDDVAMLAVMFT